MTADWRQRPEGGGHFAIWLIRSIGTHGGRALARACLYPITLYFLLRRGPERRASRQWLGRALGRPATWFDTARHIHCFAATILDRIFLLSGELDRFDIRVHGGEALLARLDQGDGVLLFGSHLGSFEALRVLAAQRPGLGLRVVYDRGHNAAITHLLDALNPEVAATAIDARQDGTTILLEVQAALARGQLVALLVDRAQPGEAARVAPFLGRDARFPLAPWQAAAIFGAPVFLGFGLYLGGNRYDLRFESFCDGEAVPRSERAAHVAALIPRYAGRLEHYALDAPFNWFNFYDYWDDGTPATAPANGDAGVGGNAGGVPGGASARHA